MCFLFYVHINVAKISIDHDDISTFERRLDHGARFKFLIHREPIDRRIRYTLNSYANARKEPRRQYTSTHWRVRASVYTLRPVFCIPSSELIQSPGPPSDFRCGEIVIGARALPKLSYLGKEK